MPLGHEQCPENRRRVSTVPPQLTDRVPATGEQLTKADITASLHHERARPVLGRNTSGRSGAVISLRRSSTPVFRAPFATLPVGAVHVHRHLLPVIHSRIDSLTGRRHWLFTPSS